MKLLDNVKLKKGTEIVDNFATYCEIKRGGYILKYTVPESTTFNVVLFYDGTEIDKSRYQDVGSAISWFNQFNSIQPDPALKDCPSMVNILEKHCFDNKKIYENCAGTTSLIRSYLRKPGVVSHAATLNYAVFLVKGARKYFGFVFYQDKQKYVQIYQEDVKKTIALIAKVSNSKINTMDLEDCFRDEIVAHLV